MTVTCDQLEVALSTVRDLVPYRSIGATINLDEAFEKLSQDLNPTDARAIMETVMKFRIWDQGLRDIPEGKLRASWKAAIQECREKERIRNRRGNSGPEL